MPATMQITIKVFGPLGDIFCDDRICTIESDTSVANIINKLSSEQPKADLLLQSCRFCINEEMVSEKIILKNGDTLFLLPPSSGG